VSSAGAALCRRALSPPLPFPSLPPSSCRLFFRARSPWVLAALDGHGLDHTALEMDADSPVIASCVSARSSLASLSFAVHSTLLQSNRFFFSVPVPPNAPQSPRHDVVVVVVEKVGEVSG
jgi:hypothetical protein